MLKSPFQVSIVFSLVALLLKIALFMLNVQHGSMETGIRYIYMLLLLVTVFFGIRANKMTTETKTTFGQDFKAGARTASFFAILVAIITYIYYSKIDPEFFVIKQQPLLDELYTSVKKDLNTKPKEELIEFLTNQIYGMRMYLSPYFQAMWTLFGLVFLGLFNSFVFALLMKKMKK